MNNKTLIAAAVMGLAMGGNATVVRPPTIIVPDIRGDEKPVSIDKSEATVEENGLYKRIRTTFIFTNPNSRQMSADFSFPIPDEATVCGYALEMDGVMVPGVVTEKEKARVAFESEKAKRVDPGIVEHVAGNVWKTRIFPLLPNTPRRAEVDYIVPCISNPKPCAERDGNDVFLAEPKGGGDGAQNQQERIANFANGFIVWDASGSAESKAAAWRKKLEPLPDNGEWTLVVFRNDAETSTFSTKAELFAKLDSLSYDGGTDIAAAFAAINRNDAQILLFTDEIDTLGLATPRYEDLPNIVIASRDPSPSRTVSVRRLAPGETPPEGVEVKNGTLLATAWAADRIKDLSSQAENRKSEFLELGRKYGVASPVTSLIVLESLDQYLKHKIEPPAAMPFHDEWVSRRAAQDDQIALKEADTEHEHDLLALWKERVEWWNNPIPPKTTPKSGLFDGIARAFGASNNAAAGNARRAMEVERAAAPCAVACEDGATESLRYREEEPQEDMEAAKKSSPNTSQAGGGGATITILPWNPKAPYIDAIAKATDPYAEYLVQKKSNGSAPAFYMDCAGWFFRKGENKIGSRILSNMAEFRLEDAAIWRSMGWRLREAKEYDMAILCFRHALRLRTEEGQSRRDLALVLAERGKKNSSKDDLMEAMALFKEAAFKNWARRSGRRSNDRQVSIIALEELNALMSWGEKTGILQTPEGFIDPAYRRDMPVKIRIVLSWDADETDIDIHVLEPDGEEAFYGHRRTSSGGFVSEDVTTGYGPEEYLRKEGSGKFKVLTNYFASHQTALTGAVTATATVYTDWGTAAEKMEILTLRLDKPKDKHLVGEVVVAE